MNTRGDIELLHRRLAKARADLAAWTAVGLSERYLEAYFAAEALEQQLDVELRGPCPAPDVGGDSGAEAVTGVTGDAGGRAPAAAGPLDAPANARRPPVRGA